MFHSPARTPRVLTRRLAVWARLACVPVAQAQSTPPSSSPGAASTPRDVATLPAIAVSADAP
ncbi:hypothetical protein ACFWXM_30440, partial [Achromobacter xylosoxidans]|uniref:hypothetical protein n=1 Tax=Alcaligenes xylosoxydans xylosoxydans TaxID=85698 RepID=UPI003762EF73